LKFPEKVVDGPGESAGALVAAHWDGIWKGLKLPMILEYSRRHPDLNEILKVLDRHLEPDPSRTALEWEPRTGRPTSGGNDTV
jgi:hypothetical protein